VHRIEFTAGIAEVGTVYGWESPRRGLDADQARS